MNKRLFTLNEPNAPRLNPALACEIGLNESIILLQIEYWISISENYQDGTKWTYQSVREMKKKSFSFWSISTINRAVNKLIDEGYLIEGNYNKKKYDSTRWFTLNFKKLKELKSIAIKGDETGVFQNDTHLNQSETGVFQNDTHLNQSETGVFQNDTRLNQNDTTIPKTTTEITTETNTHTIEQIEKVVCVLDKKINNSEAKKLLNLAGGDIGLIKEKYEIAKQSNYRSLMAWMTPAIRDDYGPITEQTDKPQERKKINTGFHNFEQRTSKYTSEEINNMFRNRAGNKAGAL